MVNQLKEFYYLHKNFKERAMKQLSSLFIMIQSILLFNCHNHGNPSPNFIIIMADDLGYGELSSYGSKSIQTPHIDRLAKEGLRFTDYHSNGAVCSPTRAALLTGQYQQRSGLEGVIYVKGETRQVGMETSTTTFAELLQAKGYATGIMGKWHLGYKKEYFPTRHGFDEFHGYVSGNVDYHTRYDNAGIYDWWHNEDSLVEEGYVTDLITHHGIDFIKKNRDRPFCLYLAHEAPHSPYQGRNDPGIRFPGKEFSYDGSVEDKNRAYKEMVEVMDEGIGRIMATLKELELDDNTLVFFCSDNGAVGKYGDNGKLRGTKTTLWEGGHRVPAIARWKGHIFPGTSDATVMSFDLAPTMIALSGGGTDHETTFDGINISPVLFGTATSFDRALVWRYRNQSAVRKDRWKLMVEEGDTLLFDLANDLSEKVNIVRQHPAVAKALAGVLGEWNKGVRGKVEQKTE